MTTAAGPLMTLVVIAAIWPFNRDRGGDEPVTIESLESRAVEVDVDRPIPASEEKAIDSYRRFLELAADEPSLRAEAMRRLADLEIETAEGEQAVRGSDPSAEHYEDSIALYTQLLEAHPDYAKNDLVLYQLARAYEARGDVDAALATLDRLVSEYPRTAHLDEANFRRGEALFVEQRYAEAEEAYRRVLDSGAGTPFHVQALYKHAWSLFKQDQHDAALDSFFALLDLEIGAASGIDPSERYAQLGRAGQELIDDALRVMSIGFAYLDGPESVTDRLDALGARPYAYVVYTSLGELYLEQERWQDAARAYREFVEHDPWHAKAPLLDVEAIRAHTQGGFADLVLDGQRGFVERYGPQSPYWTQYTFIEQPEVASHLQRNLRELAAHFHAEAQRTLAAADYAEAARWYRTYLTTFPEGDDAPATSFLLAEVLFESGNYRDAALEYERAAYAYPLHETSAEAGYAALLAYSRHEERLDGGEQVAWRRQSIDSALRFASTYPTHEQAAAVETDAAERLFDLGEPDAAREVARGVVARVPPAEPSLRRTAWTVAAHASFDLEDYAEAEVAYRQVASLVRPDDVQYPSLVERLASSIYKQGEQARARGDGSAAVEHFLRVAQAAPDSPIRATAEYDAAAVLIGLEDWTRAAGVLEAFRERFPEHELAADATANLAAIYLEAGRGAQAAAELERVAEIAGDADVRRDALWQAAELYAESDLADAASTAFGRFVERYPRPVPIAIDARQRLFELADARGDAEAARHWLTEIVDADAAAGVERNERTRLLAARAQLRLAAPMRDAFASIRLVAPLDRSLARKRERMEQALAAYGRAAEYGFVDVTTAATYEIAELYHALAAALLESERPAELADDERFQYDILLEEQAFPFEEQAIEVHELNVARTSDGIYDEWVRKSLDALAVLVPVRYAKPEIGERFVATLR